MLQRLLVPLILVWATPVLGHDCERSLVDSALIRHFRKGGDFIQTSKGFYTRVDGIWKFVPDGGGQPLLVNPPGNNAAHLAILRRQVGEERWNEISSSPNPDAALAEELRRKSLEETKLNVPDIDEVLAQVEETSVHLDLPQATEDLVLATLKRLERYASPLLPWLEPKIREGRLDQLHPGSFDDPIHKRIKKNVFVYKAVLVTVHLNGYKQFILSSGYSKIADSLHANLHSALELVVPRARRKESIPGYIIVTGWDESMKRGSVEFVTKSKHERLLIEDYSFD